MYTSFSSISFLELHFINFFSCEQKALRLSYFCYQRSFSVATRCRKLMTCKHNCYCWNSNAISHLPLPITKAVTIYCHILWISIRILDFCIYYRCFIAHLIVVDNMINIIETYTEILVDEFYMVLIVNIEVSNSQINNFSIPLQLWEPHII